MRLYPKLFPVLCLAPLSCYGGSIALLLTAGPDNQDSPRLEALSITAFDPSAQSTGVDPAASIAITFNREVLPESVGAASIEVLSGSKSIDLDFLVDGNTVVVAPKRALALLAEVTVSVSANGISDRSGGPLDQSRAITFTTRDGAWGAPVFRNEGFVDMTLAQDQEAVSLLASTEGGIGRLSLSSIPLQDGAIDNLFVADDAISIRNQVATTAAGEPAVCSLQAVSPAFGLFGYFTDRSNAPFRIDRGIGIPTDVSVDGLGTEFVVCVWIDAELEEIRTSRGFPEEEVWSEPVTLARSTGRFGFEDIQIAGSLDGTAMAVFAEDEEELFAARFNGLTWESPTRIDDSPEVENPSISSNAFGEFVVAWEASDTIRATSFVNGSWLSPVQISNEENPIQNFARAPRVSLNEAGDGFAVWRTGKTVDDFNGSDLWAARFVRQDGWQFPNRIEAPGAGAVGGLAVGVGPNGNGIAVWDEEANAGIEDDRIVKARRYRVGVGWLDTAATLANVTPGAFLTYLHIALNGDGYALVAWAELLRPSFDVRTGQFIRFR